MQSAKILVIILVTMTRKLLWLATAKPRKCQPTHVTNIIIIIPSSKLDTYFDLSP